MAASDKLGQVVLYVVRHAQVSDDAKGNFRGLENPSLDEKGEKQRDEVAEFFKDIPLSGLACDDLNRTQETLLPIAKSKGLEIQIDLGLRAWDVGTEFEGKSIEKHKKDMERYLAQPWLTPVGGQSRQEFEKIACDTFYKYVDKGMASIYPWLIADHGSLNDVILTEVGYMERSLKYDGAPVETSGIIALYLTRSGLTAKILRGKRDA